LKSCSGSVQFENPFEDSSARGTTADIMSRKDGSVRSLSVVERADSFHPTQRELDGAEVCCVADSRKDVR
jgi:hypothetical protein